MTAEQEEAPRSSRFSWSSVMDVAVPLHPNSMKRMLWDLWMFFITCFALVTDPLGLGLLPDSVPFFNVTDRLITAVFMMDIVLNFLTGYINKKERCIIMSWHDVAIRYITTWLAIDIVSSLPPEAFTSNVSETSMIKAMRVTKILTFFKISRLARVVEVINLNLDLQLSHFTWKIGGWTACCILCLHWTSCLTCWTWKLSDSSYRVIDVGNLTEYGGSELCLSWVECSARFYLRGLRTAVAFMCGHGQVVGDSEPEDLLAVICTLFGSVLYTSFIAICMSLMLEMDEERMGFLKQVERLNNFMSRNKIPTHMRKRVREYMDFFWMTNGICSSDDAVLEILSRGLQRDLKSYNLFAMLRSIPALETCDDSVLYALIKELRYEHFLAHDVVRAVGEVSREFFLVFAGAIDVCDRRGRELVSNLGPGSCFGGQVANFEGMKATKFERCQLVGRTDGKMYTLEGEVLATLIPALARRRRRRKGRQPSISIHGHNSSEPKSNGHDCRSPSSSSCTSEQLEPTCAVVEDVGLQVNGNGGMRMIAEEVQPAPHLRMVTRFHRKLVSRLVNTA